MNDLKPVQPLSFAKVYEGKGNTFVELVGGPQEAIQDMTLALSMVPGVEVVPITKAEAFIELHYRKVGAGCFLQHDFDIIANEGRRAKAGESLVKLSRRLGVGFIFEPTGFDYKGLSQEK